MLLYDHVIICVYVMNVLIKWNKILYCVLFVDKNLINLQNWKLIKIFKYLIMLK